MCYPRNLPLKQTKVTTSPDLIKKDHKFSLLVNVIHFVFVKFYFQIYDNLSFAMRVVNLPGFSDIQVACCPHALRGPVRFGDPNLGGIHVIPVG